MRKRSFYPVMLLVTAALLSACQTFPRHKVHYRVLDDPVTLTSPASQLVILPMSIRVKEMSAAGLQEEVGDWTRQAKENFRSVIESNKTISSQYTLVPIGELTGDEQKILEEHIALFDVVAGGAMQHTMLQPVLTAWVPKARHFDYTLGPGLEFLREKTGADKALILFGEDVVTTAGRKAAFVVAAVLGVGLPLGHTFLVGGVIDLQSGDILWIDYTLSVGGQTFRLHDDASALFDQLLTNYPGIESFRKGIRP